MLYLFHNLISRGFPLLLGVFSSALIIAAPVPLTIPNAGFESPVVASGGSTTSINGWTRDSASGTNSGLIHEASTNLNEAKEGEQWLFLNQGRSVGTQIGATSDTVFQNGGADRLFVGFWLTTIQNSEANAIDLSVSLYASNSTTWEGGALISSKRIQDLTNDNRSDPNSYLDSFAVLALEQATAQAAGTHYWIVFQNNLSGVAGTGMATIDEVIVNVASPPPTRTLNNPNILFALQDDMGFGDASFMNSNSKIQTPYLDSMAAQGMAFFDAHSTATVCGPSRVAILTGTAPDKLGVNGNIPFGRFGPPGLDHEEITIADLCVSAGYDTAVVGKWGIASYWPDRRADGETANLNDSNAPSILDFSKPVENAERFGFSYRYIYDEKRPFIQRETASFEGDATPYGWHENGFADREILAHSQNELHESYLRAITNKSLRYIQVKAGLRLSSDEDFRLNNSLDATADPFFLHYLTHAPHTPIVPADQFIGSSQAGLYGDFVVNLDYSLGRLMEVLDECEMTNDTLLVFTSDNGPENTAYARITNSDHLSMGPLRGLKRDLYEGGHRVPMVVRWPAAVAAGSTTNALVSLCDWYATVGAIIGQVPPDTSGLDSMNILPVLKGEAEQVRGLLLQDTAIQSNPRAIRSGPWMYIDAPTGRLNVTPADYESSLGVIDAPGNELFNIAGSLLELYNLIEIDPDQAVAMKTLFDANWPAGQRSTPPFSAQGDSDGDGYSDFFEDVHELDKMDATDVDLDVDGDGLTAVEEVLIGSDPLLYDSDGDTLADGVEAVLVTEFPPTQLSDATLSDSNLDGSADLFGDSDADGISDVYEQALTGSLDILDGGNQDSDNDGISDFNEFFSGTDATDPESRFQITGVLEEATFNEVVWNSVPQRLYNVYQSEDLMIWNLVEADLLSEGFQTQIADPFQPLDRSFYRVEVKGPEGVTPPLAPITLLNDDFDDGDPATNSSGEGNGFALYANAGSAHPIVEANGVISVTAINEGTIENVGIVSIDKIGLSDASAQQVEVTWTVDSVGPLSANGLELSVLDSPSFRSGDTQHLWNLRFVGTTTGTEAMMVGNADGNDSNNDDQLSGNDFPTTGSWTRAQLQDGFSLTLVASESGWSFTTTGLGGFTGSGAWNESSFGSIFTNGFAAISAQNNNASISVDSLSWEVSPVN